MTIQEVSTRLVSLCREGKFYEAVTELYDKNIVSVEPEGSRNRITEGFEAVAKKTEEFGKNLEEMKQLEISDALIADNYFSIAFKMNAKLAGMPEAMQMDEIGVYHVLDGKIVDEQFFHTIPEGYGE